MTISGQKMSNSCVSCVNSDLTQSPPTGSIAPIQAAEVTMNANARNKLRGFDSYPLRHVNLRISIYDLRFEKPSRAVVSGGPRVNRKSSIVNPEKGGDLHDPRKNP